MGTPSYALDGSKALYERLTRTLVDGVASSFHKYEDEEFPIAIASGHGSHITDVDGNDYIDYVLGFGPLILGHAPEPIVKAVSEQISHGSLYSAPTESLAKLSETLVEIIPCAEMVSFQSTGTESVMHAFRVARAHTGKDKIVKFEGHYHGWSDEQKVSIDARYLDEMGGRRNPRKILMTPGQPESSADKILVLPWNDLGALETCLKRHGHEIAAVVMEPFMCDSGPILPLPGYLEGVRELTRDYETLLIFDEVITGFRCALGGAQQYFGVTPDIATFAKAIAGGLPLSAICGSKEIMSCGVHASGTFNANPLSVSASLATIEALREPGVYKRFESLAERLCKGLDELERLHHVPTYTAHVGSICVLEFGFQEAPHDLRGLLERNRFDLYDVVWKYARSHGIRLTPKRGRIYLSTAHTAEDVDATLEALDGAFELLEGRWH